MLWHNLFSRLSCFWVSWWSCYCMLPEVCWNGSCPFCCCMPFSLAILFPFSIFCCVLEDLAAYGYRFSPCSNASSAVKKFVKRDLVTLAKSFCTSLRHDQNLTREEGGILKSLQDPSIVIKDSELWLYLSLLITLIRHWDNSLMKKLMHVCLFAFRSHPGA